MQPHPLNGKVVIRCLVQPHSPRKGSVDCFAVAENSGRKTTGAVYEINVENPAETYRTYIEHLSTNSRNECLHTCFSIYVRFIVLFLDKVFH